MRLVLCEGEMNAIACRAAGVDNAVAIGTTSITSEQVWLLRAHADELVFFYDSDDAGENAVWGYASDGRWYPGLVEKLSPYFRLYVVDDHEGDPADMMRDGDLEQVRALVDGAKHWLRYAVPSDAPV
jgi:DNA primase